jgi:ATP-dependent DNA helicase RecG
VLEAGEAVYDLEKQWLEQQKRTKTQKALFAKPTKQTKNTSVREKQQAVIDFCSEPRSSLEIMQHIGVTRQTRTVSLYIGELIERGAIRPLIPGKRNSP